MNILKNVKDTNSKITIMNEHITKHNINTQDKLMDAIQGISCDDELRDNEELADKIFTKIGIRILFIRYILNISI